MRLRCFFGPAHGKWIDVGTPDRLSIMARIPQKNATYQPCSIMGRQVLVMQGKAVKDVLDWLFTYDQAHPQHTDDANHPRQIARGSDVGPGEHDVVMDALKEC